MTDFLECTAFPRKERRTLGAQFFFGFDEDGLEVVGHDFAQVFEGQVFGGFAVFV